MMSMSSFGVAMPRLLFLKAVKDRHSLGKLHGVHGTVSAAHIVFHHRQHPGTAKALEHFGRVMHVTRLRQRQCIAKKSPF